ncbi:MAG: hypothetical protein U0359_03050 [Byssovorax sp.]
MRPRSLAALLFLPLALALALGAFPGCSQRSPAEATSCVCPGEAETVVDPALLAFLSKARAAHHKADRAEDDKQLDQAIGALDALVKGPLPGGAALPPEAAEVLADTRARLADLRSQLGEIEPALAEIDAGLALAPTPTHFRGHLFEVKGLILERRMAKLKEKGDAAGAEQAKGEAIKAYDEAIDIQNKVIERALPDGGPAPKR